MSEREDVLSGLASLEVDQKVFVDESDVQPVKVEDQKVEQPKVLPVITQKIEEGALDVAPTPKAKKGKKKKEVQEVGEVKVEAAVVPAVRSGRPPLYSLEERAKIAEVISQNGLTGAREILANRGGKFKKISLPTLSKIADEHNINLRRGPRTS